MTERKAILVVLACLACRFAQADVGIGWSGAMHAGGGGTLVGGPPRPHGADLGLRLHLLLGRAAHHDPPEAWSAGPFFDLHSLGVQRTDVVGGLHVSAPRFGRSLGAMRLDVGGGYSFGEGSNASAPELVVTLFGGARMPIRAHLVAHVGVYVETRVFFAEPRAVSLSAGLEIDPIGIIMAIFSAISP
jgi:hypothetical protein